MIPPLRILPLTKNISSTYLDFNGVRLSFTKLVRYQTINRIKDYIITPKHKNQGNRLKTCITDNQTDPQPSLIRTK